MLEFLRKLFCPDSSDLTECQIELKALKKENREVIEANEVLQEAYVQLSKAFDELKPEEFVYDFIPNIWKEIKYESMVTDKFVYDGVKIPQHLTDLLDSSYSSREYASECILQYKFNKDTPIKDILLKVYNKLIKDIKYVTNEVQYGIVDQWDNGDLALVSGKGDCDLSSRAFIRVISDILSMTEHPFSDRNLFLFVGYYNDGKQDFGHAWCQVNVDGDWYLFELTKETAVGSLHRPTKEYIPYFCHNDRKGWYMNNGWVSFL